MKRFRQRKAFTIVEMVIVIAVIAILATVLVPTISGVIQKANHSADQQFVASLNVQLALWQVDNGEIANESDLRNAINFYYGTEETPDFYATLSPKSAPQGYHYWWDADENTFVLSKYEGLFEEGDTIVASQNKVAFLSNRQPLAENGEKKPHFSPANPRSLMVEVKEGKFKNFFLVDQKGSELADIFDEMDILGSDDGGQDYEDMIVALDKLADEGDELVGLILDKLSQTAIITDYGVFRYSADDVAYAHISGAATALNGIVVYEYDEETKKVGSAIEGGDVTTKTDIKIELPSGVKVNVGGFMGFENTGDDSDLKINTPELHVNASIDELKDFFEAGSIDCVIVLPDGSRYEMDVDGIYRLPRTEDDTPAVDDLGITSIEKIEIGYNDSNTTPNADDDYFYTTNDILYLAWDFGSAKLVPVGIKIEGEEEKEINISSGMIEWTVSDGAMIDVAADGTITLNENAKPDDAKATATVTATLKSDATKIDNITVQLVFPNNLSWKLGEKQYSAPILNSAFNLEYTGTAAFTLSQVGVGFTQEDYVKMNATDLVINFSTSGTLFSIADGELTIDPDKIETNPTQKLTVTYGNAETTYITQEYTVTVIDNSATPFEKNPIKDNECNDSNCTDKDNCTHNDLLMGDTYLFRVGNGNTIKLGTLFNVDEAPRKIKLTIYDASKWDNDNGVYDEINKTKNDLDATYTSSLTPDNWASSTIQFTGTGVAIIRIENEATKDYKELAVEVVDGNNVTTYSELKGNVNSVLLSDIKMTSNGNFNLSANKYIYGNGFTFDITQGQVEKSKRFGIIELASGSLLDNVVVIGATFPNNFGNSYDGENGSDYYVAAVYLNGGTISNSYISGCRTPVRSAGGTIINTTLQGGKYGNLYADAGTTTIENLTTINQPGSVDGNVGGLGIVLDNSAVLKINGKLTQHNWINNAEGSFGGSNQYASQLFGIIFADKDQVKHIQFAYDGKTWVNTGIFRLKNTTSIMGNVTGYGQVEASGSAYGMKFTGYAYTFSKNESYVFNGRVTPATYVPTKQGAHAPTITWSDDAYKDGKHDIKFDEGDTAKFNPNVLTATHYGNSLTVNVTMDGVVYTGKEIEFNDKETTTHTIVYSYYAEPCYDKDGNKISDKVLFEQTLEVKVTVAKKVGAPTFTFYYGTSGKVSAGSPHVTQPSNSYAGKVEEAGGAYYIMPNVSATSADAIGSKTINGKTIYYPIVDGINVRSGSSTDYDFTRHYPIFKAVSISDNGKAYSYTATKDMPDTVTWVSAEIDSGNGASALNDGFGLYNDQYLCKIQKKAGNAESGGTAVVKFSYVAEDGNTYYYFVGYKFYDEDEGGACFTPNTLVTLADGTQKRVDELKPTDKILAWDFFTGKYVEKKISLLVNHGEALYKVTNLKFSDGTELKLIGEHGVFDYDLNKYVYFTPENYAEYIGHNFVKQNLNGGYDLVQLVDGTVTEEYTSAWSVSSAETSNAFASGMLTVAPPEDFYNWIEMSGKLQYNVEQFAADVEKYGLYTYEDFADYVTYEQFVEWNGAYLKIAVEKGYFTFEYILELIEMYKSWMP